MQSQDNQTVAVFRQTPVPSFCEGAVPINISEEKFPDALLRDTSFKDLEQFIPKNMRI
jgi:hypothetical protein